VIDIPLAVLGGRMTGLPVRIARAITGVVILALIVAACSGGSTTSPAASVVATTALPVAARSAAAPSASSEGKVSGPNGRIVFARHTADGQDDHSFIANADGSGVRELLPAFTSSSPHWSPDGREVAVVSGLGTPCPPTCTGNTVIIKPDAGSYRVLRSKGFPAVSTFCSIWSPDGGQFACEGGNDANGKVNGIYTIRASDGGGLTRITNAGGLRDIPIAWSPDGRQIVFGRNVSDNSGTCIAPSAIYVVNVDGSNLRRITPAGYCDDDGSWSPDGSLIAFVTNDGTIYTVHPDGTGLTPLALATATQAYAGDVAWSPDGRQIVFILSTRDAGGAMINGLGTANADGTNVRRITSSPTFDHSADWGSNLSSP
jgi:Tol biopolymer transport system component